MKTQDKKPDPSTAIVKYGEWSPEQMATEAKELASGSGDFWKVPVGRTTVRFLPPKIGWPSPFVIQHQHFIEMPGLPKPVIFACPKMHEGTQCLACDKAKAMETTGNSRDGKASYKLKPSKRILANVIIDPSNAESAVMVWGFGKTVYDALKSIREDDENGGNFTDPISGFNIVVKREGTKKDDTRYTVIPGRGQTPLANMEWIDQQQDLRRLIRIPTVDQQKRLFEGEDPKDVWGDDESARKPRSRRDEEVIDVDPGKRTAEDDLFDEEIDLD